MARAKKKTIHYIYKTTCTVTGRYYIGMHSTNDINDGYMGSGRRLRRSIRKHGKDNHTNEILEYYDTRDLLIEAEKEVITEDMIGDSNCMNLKGGGEGGYISEEHYININKIASKWLTEKWKDKEFRERTSKIAGERMKQYHKEGKINYNTFEGKSHSDESKQKMSESKKGTGTGEKNSQYGTCWITMNGENKKIKKEDLTSWLEEGWVKGRKI